MALLHSPRIVTDGLILCLDAANRQSYPGSGTVWRDLAGSNNGTLINGPTFSSANGGSLVFDGSNDYVNLGSSNNITGNNLQTLTIGMWLKYSTTSLQRPLSLNSGADGSSGFLIGMNINNTFNVTSTTSVGSLGFITRNFNNTVFTSLTFNDNYHLKNRFINIFCVVNGLNRLLYIDGELKNSDSGFGMLSVSGNTLPAHIASNRIAGQNLFNGFISNCLFYRRALTSAEILQNYNALKGRYNL